MNRSANSISLVRTIDAPPGEVFAAWTDPTLMRRWLAPGTCGRTTVEVEADARVGGRFLIADMGPRDVLFTTGEYRELAPSQRVVMTWSSGELLEEYRDKTTLVTVTMRALEPALTELTLTHSGVAAGDETGLCEGWANCLDKLKALYASDSKISRAQDHAAS